MKPRKTAAKAKKAKKSATRLKTKVKAGRLAANHDITSM